ncbi:MAG: flavin-containing monooxygenase, partial [Solirubrobacteraceae bacterium]
MASSSQNGSAPAVTLPRACIIGAGSSGIAAAKALLDRGVPFDCFECSDQVGGNWVFGNRNGMSAAYRDLFINVSRERMAYADFPMPESYPDFPHHTHIKEYFDNYVDHFGLREHITFETGVEHATRREDGVWEVRIEHGGDGGTETREYDALLVANGHHWDARWPEPAFQGADTFAGTQLHAHSYVDNSIFAGKDVVVLGMGNSAMDIAVESSYVAANTYLSARKGAWIIPKYVFGKPLDQLPNDPRVPFAIRQRVIHQTIKTLTGPPERYGLPKPDHKFGEAHPTVSGRILDRISHGTITPKPNIERLEGERVRFIDGSDVHAEVIVYCTGYKISFPFFHEGFLAAPENHIELFRR